MRGYLENGNLGTKVSPVVSGETRGFSILGPITHNGSFGSANTNTIKCLIAADDLMSASFVPARMWITLGQWVAATRPITFSKVYIGHQDTTAGRDPWDATSLTQVFFGGAPSTVISPPPPALPGEPDPPPNTSRSDPISFVWDGSALILSMHFAGGMSSDQLTARTTGNSNTYLKNGVDEAATPDATGYAEHLGFLSGVVRIEVA